MVSALNFGVTARFPNTLIVRESAMIQNHYLHLIWGLLITPLVVLITYTITEINAENRAIVDKAKWSDEKYTLGTAFINCLLKNQHFIGSHIERFQSLEDCADYVLDEEDKIGRLISQLIAPESLESIDYHKKPRTYHRGNDVIMEYHQGDRVLIFMLPDSQLNKGTEEGFYPSAYVVYIRNDHVFAVGLNGVTVIL